ncbi:hypothetical protein [Pontibacter sp. G13]|uniref:hypothetical protein n=1 Tax=Pontibacter sp. G13 TaxID=3074898 RepID=UPI00288B98C4|nr:hypothetical protein [Pontibacter sp. G13]WNJ16311.1 hypothetical protein RJD25_15715 [Pontibacter sp. G13]
MKFSSTFPGYSQYRRISHHLLIHYPQLWMARLHVAGVAWILGIIGFFGVNMLLDSLGAAIEDWSYARIPPLAIGLMFWLYDAYQWRAYKLAKLGHGPRNWTIGLVHLGIILAFGIPIILAYRQEEGIMPVFLDLDIWSLFGVWLAWEFVNFGVLLKWILTIGVIGFIELILIALTIVPSFWAGGENVFLLFATINILLHLGLIVNASRIADKLKMDAPKRIGLGILWVTIGIIGNLSITTVLETQIALGILPEFAPWLSLLLFPVPFVWMYYVIGFKKLCEWLVAPKKK